MAPHSSTLAWKIPWTEEPGGLQSMGSLRVRYNWVASLSLFTFMHWRRKWQPTPVFLPGESQGRGSLVVYGVTQSRTLLKRLSSSSNQGYIWLLCPFSLFWFRALPYTLFILKTLSFRKKSNQLFYRLGHSLDLSDCFFLVLFNLFLSPKFIINCKLALYVWLGSDETHLTSIIHEWLCFLYCIVSGTYIIGFPL